MNTEIRLLNECEVAAVGGGFDGYCGTLPLHWPLPPRSVFEPEPAPWLPTTVWSGP